MKIRTCGSSLQGGCWNAWTWIKNINSASCLSNFWNFFGVIQIISCHDWWPWMKPGYITMTWRQSDNQWSCSIVAHPAPKNSESKNLLEKFSPRFFGIKTASSLIIFQRAKLSTWSITHLCWCNWRTFWRKNAVGRSPKGSYSCTTMTQLTRHLQPRKNWPTWASIVVITHAILRIWPRQTSTCSLDQKNDWKVAIFRLMWRSFAATETWLDGQTSEVSWVACKS